MKALSIRQPWVELILRFGKDVENRSWCTRYRGTLWLHASHTIDVDVCRLLNIPACELITGAIVGQVELVDCVRDSASAWAWPGAWHWLLRAARPSKPIYCRGHLGFFEPFKQRTTHHDLSTISPALNQPAQLLIPTMFEPGDFILDDARPIWTQKLQELSPYTTAAILRQHVQYQKHPETRIDEGHACISSIQRGEI